MSKEEELDTIDDSEDSTVSSERAQFAAELGLRIRYHRRSLNMTAEALSSAIGTSRARLSAWETGKGMPDLFGFSRLCNALQVSPTDLLIRDQNTLYTPFARVKVEYDSTASRGVHRNDAEQLQFLTHEVARLSSSLSELRADIEELKVIRNAFMHKAE